MAKARFIYNNLWRIGTPLTASPIADPQHPLTDTQIDTLSMYFKASAATTPCTIPMNLGAGAGAIDFVTILGHNIDSDATITIEGADNAAFDSGLVSRTLTYNAVNIFEFFTAFTKQYVRIKLVSGNGNFSAAPQVATILCGNYEEFNCNFDWKYLEGDIDPSEISYSDSMVVFAQEKDEIFRGEYLFASLNDTYATKAKELNTLCGIHKAFVICFDSANANTQSRWVRLLSISQPKHIFHDIWSWSCPIEEIK